MALQQFQINGTFYGYDPSTGEGVAFSSLKSFQSAFGNVSPDPNAPQLPVDPTKLNASPDQSVTVPPPANQLTGQGLTDAQLTAYGIDPTIYKSSSPLAQALVQQSAAIAQANYQTGLSNVSINQQLLTQALTAAQADPTIQARYGDSLSMASQSLGFNLAQINSSWNVNQSVQQLQQRQQQQQLEAQVASAGQASSGYRQQAQDLLKAQQKAVIQSSNSQLQQQVQSLGQSAEAQFGTAKLPSLPPLSAGGYSYTPTGNVTGSDTTSKQQDILNRQSQIYSQEASPLTGTQ